MKDAKYAKFSDSIDHRVKRFRWPFWLLPLLFLCLILVLGLFIFITLHSTGRFCLFHCEQKIDDGGLVAPTEAQTTGNPDEGGLPHDEQYFGNKKREHDKSKHDMITVKGKITLPKGHMMKSIPPNSQLKVVFEDTSIADAPSKKIFEMIVDLSKYKEGSNITYAMEFERPEDLYLSYGYSVSAVFNIGWTPKKGGDQWLRAKDYFTDTIYNVELTKEGKYFVRDIDLAYYSSS